ncbi:MAG: ABC transporter permease [Alphaproteobacteria bacterium]|nr:ABC transporter permease [Alphaproteobacteria bacterium]MBU0805506.1 ABC transporter permease [Alphaproteobacteria bacterium]MBU0873452.1 ABC transporter permease [Alphaproteobacteria bacterium]MBU1401320.1 ABC transporter permease [Alphaproteobacteria bacterium]MBU1592263.1 ABC transporter permease [Alphaproteobacteria bacterium]
MMAFFRGKGWVTGLFVLLALLFVFTRVIQPNYGANDFGSLVRAVLPFAFAVAAQTVVVIAGGIDLSVASMMALTSVIAAAMMDGASEEFALLVVPFVLLVGFALGALNGILIVVTRVPDIVVTLAMLFVLQGAALLVLGAPGGSAAEWLKELVVGTVGMPGVPEAVTDWIPKGLVLLLVCLGVVWIPLRRSWLGLSIYAIGSNQLAAFRSGVPVARTRIVAYAIAGLFGAMGGLTLTMSTGIGAPIPGPYLLASVASVVLGGVVLGGGRGGLVGPIVAVFLLRLVRTDLTLLAIDPNVAAIVEGTIMVVVVMLGAFLAMRGRTQ